MSEEDRAGRAASSAGNSNSDIRNSESWSVTTANDDAPVFLSRL